MKHVNLRIPDDVHAKLVALAEAQRRSLNSMIIVLIEEASGERDSPPPLKRAASSRKS